MRILHGECKTPLFKKYASMLSRCFSPKSGNYPKYGGRGITVCNEWRGPEGFINFKAWSLENCPNLVELLITDKYQIDRIDNDGNYTRENCRWVSPTQNMRNRKCSIKVDMGELGIMHIIDAIAIAITKTVTYNSVLLRIKRGWTPEAAVTTPRLPPVIENLEAYRNKIKKC